MAAASAAALDLAAFLVGLSAIQVILAFQIACAAVACSVLIVSTGAADPAAGTAGGSCNLCIACKVANGENLDEFRLSSSHHFCFALMMLNCDFLCAYELGNQWGCPADLLTNKAVLDLKVHSYTTRAPVLLPCAALRIFLSFQRLNVVLKSLAKCGSKIFS